MTRGDELTEIRNHTAKSLYLIDSLPRPISPATQCLYVALKRVAWELGQVADEKRRAAL